MKTIKIDADIEITGKIQNILCEAFEKGDEIITLLNYFEDNWWVCKEMNHLFKSDKYSCNFDFDFTIAFTDNSIMDDKGSAEFGRFIKFGREVIRNDSYDPYPTFPYMEISGITENEIEELLNHFQSVYSDILEDLEERKNNYDDELLWRQEEGLF